MFWIILLLFSHTNQQQRIFCVVRLKMDIKAATNIPFWSHHRSRIYVTDIAHLDCLAMQLPSLYVKDKNCYLYPGMMKHMFLNTRKIKHYSKCKNITLTQLFFANYFLNKLTKCIFFMT